MQIGDLYKCASCKALTPPYVTLYAGEILPVNEEISTSWAMHSYFVFFLSTISRGRFWLLINISYSCINPCQTTSDTRVHADHPKSRWFSAVSNVFEDIIVVCSLLVLQCHQLAAEHINTSVSLQSLLSFPFTTFHSTRRSIKYIDILKWLSSF